MPRIMEGSSICPLLLTINRTITYPSAPASRQFSGYFNLRCRLANPPIKVGFRVPKACLNGFNFIILVEEFGSIRSLYAAVESVSVISTARSEEHTSELQ